MKSGNLITGIFHVVVFKCSWVDNKDVVGPEKS